MDIDEALEILGLDPSADRLTAKRAYLRQVKVHKPELDPDGFQRAPMRFATLRGSAYGHSTVTQSKVAIVGIDLGTT